MRWWPTTIGELVERGVVSIQTGPFGSQLHAHDYRDDGVHVVPTEAIRDRRINRSVCPIIDEQKAVTLVRHRLEVGDILFARRGVQATGHIGVVRAAEAGFICGTGAIRLRVAANDVVDAEYLSHVLADPASVSWLKHHAVGATMPNLNEGIIKSFPLSLPSIQYQRRVGAFMSALDDKIELNRRMNETLEAMAHAIFRDWFVDFGPVRRKLAGERDPIAIMGGLTSDLARAAKTAAFFPDTLDERDGPAGWVARTIGDLADVVGGSTPSTADESLWQPPIYAWATPKDLSAMSDLALFDTSRRISEKGLKAISSGLLPRGSVLLSSRAPIGYLAIAQVPVAVNQGFIALKPNDDVGSAFLYAWCKANLPAIIANANGSTFQEISKRNFRPIPVLAPPTPDLLKAFDEIAGPLFERIASAACENRTLSETRDYLLPRLMSGNLRVADAGEAAEAAA